MMKLIIDANILIGELLRQRGRELLHNSDLAPFLKELSRNGFEDNFKAITRSNIGISSDEVEKF